ncbi:hypothetical protein N0V88_003685 [Collariella sp. IMI 366227]|nr:hypothetical protein N0V88_003685 [Collariella sp. IMI 366227]
MRHAIFLFAATAAFVLGDAKLSQNPLVEVDESDATTSVVQDWWDSLHDAQLILSSLNDPISEAIQSSHRDSFFTSIYDKDRVKNSPPRPREGPGHRGPRGDPEKTIYEQIKECKYTSRFAKLVDEHDEIKALLQDTKHNHTLFVPTNRAFERLPHHRHGRHGHDSDDDGSGSDSDGNKDKPPKEFILALLKYHIAHGLWPLEHIRAHTTIPSSLYPPALNGKPSHDDSSTPYPEYHTCHPQRIRVFTTPFIPLTRLNFHVRLSPHTADLVAKNGLVHPIDSFLVPPPSQTSLIRLLPSHFSTLALALETTGLGDELDDLPRTGGGTFFAPTNSAWSRLGGRANAFLFSERGKKYLKALVKYHAVVNETLYSDAFYRPGEKEEREERVNGDYWHADMPTLLCGKPISVIVKTWRGFVSIVVNGWVRVVVRDGIADDGVLQVVERVIIPPHKPPRDGHGHGEEEEGGEISEEELVARLEPYMELAGGRKDMGDL